MQQVMHMLMQFHAEWLRRDSQRENRDQEKRLNITRELAKVSSIEGETLMRELAKVELRIEELGITFGRQLMRTLREAKSWIEFARHQTRLG